MGSVLNLEAKGTFGIMFKWLILISVGMAVLNLFFLITAKVKKRSGGAFPLLFTVIVAVFNVAFSFMFTSDKGETHVENNLSPEIILFIFLAIFTLAAYALTLGAMDSAFASDGQDSGPYFVCRNILNAFVGAGLIVLGVHLLNLDGKYTDVKGNLVLSHEKELDLAGMIMLLIGIMSLLNAAKRYFHKVSIDAGDRMIGRGKGASGEWQPGETLPINESLLRYNTIGMVFDSIMSLIVYSIIIVFFFTVANGMILFIVPAFFVVVMLMGLTIKNSVDKVKYLKNYQFGWKYGKITAKEEQQEKHTTNYQDGVRTTTTTHFMIVLDNREMIEIDHESNLKYGVGAEVFVLNIYREQKSGLTGDLSTQVSTYANKCELYG